MKYHILIEPRTIIVNNLINYRKVLNYNSLLKAKRVALNIFNKIVNVHDIQVMVTNNQDIIHDYHELFLTDEDFVNFAEDEDEMRPHYIISSSDVFHSKYKYFRPTKSQLNVIKDGFETNPGRIAQNIKIPRDIIDTKIDDFEYYNGNIDLNDYINLLFIRACLKNSTLLLKSNRKPYHKAAKQLEDMFYVKIPR